MTTLIFFGTIITIFTLLTKIVVKMVNQTPVGTTPKILLVVVLSYAILWCVFYFASSNKTVPLGTNICFDDWCATVTKIEQPKTLGIVNQELEPHGHFVILTIKISNHAKGISQKPSEPRVHIFDDNGNFYSFSEAGQKALETQKGRQIPIDERLELSQSLETQLVFDIPVQAKDPKVVIEEGPFITKLLFSDNKEVFLLPLN